MRIVWCLIATSSLCVAQSTTISEPSVVAQSGPEPTPGMMSDQPFGTTEFDLEAFHSYDEIVEFMYNTLLGKGNFSRVMQVARTRENRTVQAMKIGKPKNGSHFKPSIIIEAGIHGREWGSIAVAVQLIDMLAKQSETDSEQEKLITELDWFVIPVANPDGYTFSRQYNTYPRQSPEFIKHRFWRKNRSPQRPGNRKGIEKNCSGVDLNRNFDFHFGEVPGPPISNNSCIDIYCGERANSEPETAGIKRLVEGLMKQGDHLKAYISLHSFGMMWMHSYGHVKDANPTRHGQRIAEVARAAVDAMFNAAVEGLVPKKFCVGTPSDCLPSTKGLGSGSSLDWVTEQGVTYSYSVELRIECGWRKTKKWLRWGWMRIASPNLVNFDVILFNRKKR